MINFEEIHKDSNSEEMGCYASSQGMFESGNNNSEEVITVTPTTSTDDEINELEKSKE